MTYHTLMTQTLPTIVGAGVVSRTTETMFGRGGVGRGDKRGRRLAAKSKKFDGKTYRAANWRLSSKAQAVKDATYFRKAGHNARVVRECSPQRGKWGYTVYVH